MEGFFWGWESLFLHSLSLSGLCSVVQGGASVREHHTNRDLLGSNNTKTLAEFAKSWHSGVQDWKTPTINDSLKRLEAEITC